jgi:hypothetical protein
MHEYRLEDGDDAQGNLGVSTRSLYHLSITTQ